MGEAVRQLIKEEADAVEAAGVTQLRAVEKLEQPEQVGGRKQITDYDAIVEYVESVPADYVQCRENQRHTYPPIDPRQMRLTPTEDGYDEVKTTCTECGMAFKFEVWMIKENPDGTVFNMRLIDQGMGYHKPKENQPAYLMPKGTGRVARRDFREVRVSQYFVGKKIRRAAAPKKK